MNRTNLKLMIAGVLASCTLSVSASQTVSTDDMAFMKQQQKALEAFKAQLPQSLAGMAGLPLPQQERVQKYQNGIQSQLPTPEQGQEKATPQAIYFVSLSIPSEGLLPMLADAHRFGIPATLRGLVDNDFRKTAAVIFELTKENKDVGVQIDPTLYQRYGITAVPALVVTCPGHSDVIRGSLPLEKALQKIADDGDCAQIAKNILGRKS